MLSLTLTLTLTRTMLGRNNSRVSSLEDHSLRDLKKLTLQVLLRLFLGRNEIWPEDMMAWQEDYEYYGTTIMSLPINIEALSPAYAEACARFESLAKQVRNSPEFTRRLFSKGLSDTSYEAERKAAKRFLVTLVGHAYPLLSGLLVNSISLFTKYLDPGDGQVMIHNASNPNPNPKPNWPGPYPHARKRNERESEWERSSPH